jgi:transcriptional regulator with XRE-family HTH domain
LEQVAHGRYGRAMNGSIRPVGDLLREWRQRRRLSQLDLASEAEISTRHLSFLETGRSQPSRDMVLHLAEQLDVPLRDRNVLLQAAGYAAVFPERPLGDPALKAARQAIDQVLAGHEPNPALAVDRHWTLIASNAATRRLLAGTEPSLLRPPVNVLRLSLHPQGLAPRTANLGEWREHLLARLRRQIDISGDPVLVRLLRELRAYPGPDGPGPDGPGPDGPGPDGPASNGPGSNGPGSGKADGIDRDATAIAVPFRLVTAVGVLAFFSTTTVFGTPVDITLSELAVEAFFPADQQTADALRRLAA